MQKVLSLELPGNFSFRHAVYSHGWCDLPPFRLDTDTWTLHYVFAGGARSKPFSASMREADGRLIVELATNRFDEGRLINDIRHILRMDENLQDFYRIVENEAGLGWVTSSRAGRLLRSPTVFEDLVKTICTTNCSWGLTRKMVSNLVDKLGAPDGTGKNAFPTAEAMASMPTEFYRDEIRAGYRSPYFVELANSVVNEDLDPESWLNSELPTQDLKKEMKSVKGVGDYAAENLLKLVGRYDGLALDSWLRSQFYKKHNREKACDDKKIERHYKKFGDWRGLVIWCDMTARWMDEIEG